MSTISTNQLKIDQASIDQATQDFQNQTRDLKPIDIIEAVYAHTVASDIEVFRTPINGEPKYSDSVGNPKLADSFAARLLLKVPGLPSIIARQAGNTYMDPSWGKYLERFHTEVVKSLNTHKGTDIYGSEHGVKISSIYLQKLFELHGFDQMKTPENIPGVYHLQQGSLKIENLLDGIQIRSGSKLQKYLDQNTLNGSLETLSIESLLELQSKKIIRLSPGLRNLISIVAKTKNLKDVLEEFNSAFERNESLGTKGSVSLKGTNFEGKELSGEALDNYMNQLKANGDISPSLLSSYESVRDFYAQNFTTDSGWIKNQQDIGNILFGGIGLAGGIGQGISARLLELGVSVYMPDVKANESLLIAASTFVKAVKARVRENGPAITGQIYYGGTNVLNPKMFEAQFKSVKEHMGPQTQAFLGLMGFHPNMPVAIEAAQAYLLDQLISKNEVKGYFRAHSPTEVAKIGNETTSTRNDATYFQGVFYQVAQMIKQMSDMNILEDIQKRGAIAVSSITNFMTLTDALNTPLVAFLMQAAPYMNVRDAAYPQTSSDVQFYSIVKHLLLDPAFNYPKVSTHTKNLPGPDGKFQPVFEDLLDKRVRNFAEVRGEFADGGISHLAGDFNYTIRKAPVIAVADRFGVFAAQRTLGSKLETARDTVAMGGRILGNIVQGKFNNLKSRAVNGLTRRLGLARS